MNRADRNNNPGNIKLPQGGLAIAAQRYNDPNISIDPTPASDGGSFLKFSSPDLGKQATSTLLTSPGYSSLSVNDALKKWSGGGYDGSLVPDLSGKTISQLSPDDLNTITSAMFKREGYTGQNTQGQGMQSVQQSNQQFSQNNPQYSMTQNPSPIQGAPNEPFVSMNGQNFPAGQQSQSSSKMSLQQFGDSIKKKYGTYSSTDSTKLAQAVLQKYPVYANMIDQGQSAPQTQQDVPQQDTTQQSAQPQTQSHDNPLTKFAVGTGKTVLDVANTIGKPVAKFLAGALGFPTTNAGDNFANQISNTANTLDNGPMKTAGQVFGYAAPAAVAGLSLAGIGAGADIMANPIVKNALGEITDEALPNISNAQKFDMITNALKEAPASDKLVLQTALRKLLPSVAQEINVPLEELLPAVQKAGSLKKALTELGIGYEILKRGGGYAKGLYDKYIGSQIPGQNDTVTINPAP